MGKTDREQATNKSVLYRKIFPPTSEELPPNEQPTEAVEDHTSKAVSKDTTASEPLSKKLKPESEAVDEGWEPVEKPNDTASEKTTDISDEGEKVEAPDLAGSDGEKVEKSEPKDVLEEGAVSEKVMPEHTIGKDW